MEERYIASADLGTSKISVCVARIENQDVQVIYYKESPSDGIRNSYVFNPRKVEAQLRKAITEAQQDLRIKVQKVIVGLPRYYVRQETASAGFDRNEEDSQIQESEIRLLKSNALESYPLSDNKKEVIYGAVAQSFSTEDSFNEVESDIVGMTAARLDGHFKVFVGERRYSSNIDNVFSSMGIGIARKYFVPGITAKAVLKDEQMENGVALFDLGAGVSSVTIFKNKILRFYAAIPFGGNSITNDIKSQCNISTELAENIKKAYGACMPNKLSSFGEKIIQINDEDTPAIQISVKYLSEIITARMKEIVEALLYEIQMSGYADEDQLRAGVVVTGGGAELVNCANYIRELSGYSVKTATSRRFFSCEGCPEAMDSSAATTMGMILAAKNDKSLNCTSFPVTKSPVSTVGAQPQRPSRTASAPSAPAAKETPATSPAPDPQGGSTAPAVTAEESPAVTGYVQRPEEKEEKKADAEFIVPKVRVEQPREEETSVSIEPSVAAAQDNGQDEDEGPSVFDPYTEKEIKDAGKKKGKASRAARPDRPRITWLKHISEKATEGLERLFNDMEE